MERRRRRRRYQVAAGQGRLVTQKGVDKRPRVRIRNNPVFVERFILFFVRTAMRRLMLAAVQSIFTAALRLVYSHE